MSTAPQWALDLIEQVCRDEGREVRPNLIWRHRRALKNHGSSGYCAVDLSRIVVTAGGPRHEQKLVLLHELAHWLRPRTQRSEDWHSDAFWIKAFELFRRYKVPIRYAKWRETNYKKGAIVGYVANLPQRTVKKPEPEPDDEWGITSAIRDYIAAIDLRLAPE